MAKVQYRVSDGSLYEAWKANYGVRFQKDGQPVKEVTVPKEIVASLKNQLGMPIVKEPTRFEQATAPEVAATVQPSPEPAFENTPLSPTDFADTIPSTHPTQIEVSSPQQEEPYASAPLPTMHPTEEAYYRGIADANSAGSERESGLMNTVAMLEDQINDLQMRYTEVSAQKSTAATPAQLAGLTIMDAPLEDLARAMYERFGIFTVFTRRYPEADEISPLTGEPMTNYDRGIAYQAARRAFEQGRLDNADYSSIKHEADRSREASNNFQQRLDSPVVSVPNFQEDRTKNNFDYRTSVRGGNENPNGMRHVRHLEEDEPLAEPNMNQLNASPIIRPEW